MKKLAGDGLRALLIADAVLTVVIVLAWVVLA